MFQSDGVFGFLAQGGDAEAAGGGDQAAQPAARVKRKLQKKMTKKVKFLESEHRLEGQELQL